ncbi:MAG TPA: hypothetical protein VFI93_02010, partial [Rhizomicrobium sp.]|nr:hypothetical protein [Rhizomicrobium sp.]
FLYPVALSNLGTAHSDGTADLGKDKVIAARYFEKAAGLGKADAAINAGDYYAKAGDTVKARHFFGRAIMLNPSTAERARANKHLAALGNTAQPVTPASAPSATDVRSDVISQGFMCIDDSRKISRSANILFLEQRKLDKRKEYLRRRTAEYNAKSKELESATKKMSDEEIGKYLHATIEIKNQIAEYNSENKQFNMLMQAFKELKDKYNKRCDEMKVTIAEFKQLCSGDNADVDWCKSFN